MRGRELAKRPKNRRLGFFEKLFGSLQFFIFRLLASSIQAKKIMSGSSRVFLSIEIGDPDAHSIAQEEYKRAEAFLEANGAMVKK